jgi:hypothetical protein
MHGRVEGAQGRCAVPGCLHAGEYKATLQAANFDGPGVYRLMCLDHVREHNAGYNYFQGMSPEEITEAQTPFGGWDRPTRAFATFGGDPPPAWSDFADPLDAIGGRFRRGDRRSTSRFTPQEQRALDVLGLGDDADKAAVRKRYGQLLRRYHPDKNKGERTHERRLGEVIDAYQTLRSSTALA